VEIHISLVGRRDLGGEIYRQLRHAILDGRLRPGDRLTPTRVLAKSLGVSRTTTTTAYERLVAEGYVTTRVGAGTYVTDRLPRRRRRRRRVDSPVRPRPVWESVPLPTAFSRPAGFDLRPGVPDSSLFPFQVWRRVTARALRLGSVGKGLYGDPAGDPRLREAIARHIGISRGMSVAADDVTVTNGTQQALDIVTRAVVAPGEVVAVEDPGYTPPRYLLTSLGAVVRGAPVDVEGIVVDALDPRARLVCVAPSHQFPLGVSMSLSRRLALIDWADRHDAVVVEDDYDGEFRFSGRPLEPLQTLDEVGRVVYVGSFSKTMLPTLRLGFVVTPPSLTRAVRAAKFVSDWHTSLPAQDALAAFLDEGEFARHVRRVSDVYRQRHEMVMTFLANELTDRLDVIPSDIGLHVTARSRTISVEEIGSIVERAIARDVGITDVARFAYRTEPEAGLVLGYGAIETSRLGEALRRLRSCFDASGSG
jgi:GntR family transcriptional regulator/MocR family aminotransferase